MPSDLRSMWMHLWQHARLYTDKQVKLACAGEPNVRWGILARHLSDGYPDAFIAEYRRLERLWMDTARIKIARMVLLRPSTEEPEDIIQGKVDVQLGVWLSEMRRFMMQRTTVDRRVQAGYFWTCESSS